MKSYSDTTLGWAHLEKVARIGRGHSSLAGGTQPKGFEPTNDAISRSAIWREAIKDLGYDATICDPVECSDCSKNEILLCKWTILSPNMIFISTLMHFWYPVFPSTGGRVCGNLDSLATSIPYREVVRCMAALCI